MKVVVRFCYLDQVDLVISVLSKVECYLLDCIYKNGFDKRYFHACFLETLVLNIARLWLLSLNKGCFKSL